MPEENRKTGIPIKGIPDIVDFLIRNCSQSELEWMASMAERKNFSYISSIFTKLTDFNVHEVFYERGIRSGEELLVFRAAKRGEVAGLKAFQMACQAAKVELDKRKEQAKNGSI